MKSNGINVLILAILLLTAQLVHSADSDPGAKLQTFALESLIEIPTGSEIEESDLPDAGTLEPLVFRIRVTLQPQFDNAFPIRYFFASSGQPRAPPV